MRTGRKAEWDAANLKAKGVPAADAIIKEDYREDWEVALRMWRCRGLVRGPIDGKHSPGHIPHPRLSC